jgi:hypothetical protein
VKNKPCSSYLAAVASRRRGQRPRKHDQLPASHNERRRGATAWAPRPRTCAALRASAWAPRSRTFEAKQSGLREAAWTPRSSTFAAPRARAWAPRLCTCDAQRGNGLGTTIKFPRRTTSGAAGNGLGTTITYLRRSTSGAAGNCLGTAIPYLRRTTSGAAGNGAAGNGLSRYRGLLMCPLSTSAPLSSGLPRSGV